VDAFDTPWLILAVALVAQWLAAYGGSKHGALRVLFGAIMGATVLLLTALHVVEAAAWAVVHGALSAGEKLRH